MALIQTKEEPVGRRANFISIEVESAWLTVCETGGVQKVHLNCPTTMGPYYISASDSMKDGDQTRAGLVQTRVQRVGPVVCGRSCRISGL